MVHRIIKTKFLPPGSGKVWWKKPKLWEKYERIVSYPLTVVKAGPGYGKSITLASFLTTGGKKECYWYNIDEMDADPALFFLNIFYAFQVTNKKIGQASIEILTTDPNSDGDFVKAINYFINDLLTHLKKDSYFVLDDFYLVGDNPQIIDLLSYFIKMLPPQLHLVISTRENLKFKDWANWRLQRMVLIVDEDDLILNSKEIVDFFDDQFGISISKNDAARVENESEGWIIALDLLGQGLKHGTKLEHMLNNKMESIDLLFEYLASEILETQKDKVQEFLLKTAVLKHLRVDVCNQLLQISDSKQILEKMVAKGLFVYSLAPDQYRYHHLVREFLHKSGKEKFDYKKLHEQSAEIHLKIGETNMAIFHSLEAENYEQATRLIISSADKMLRLGRLDSLKMSLGELPKEMYNQYPQLYIYQGELFRIRNKFNDALDSYKKGKQLFRERQEWVNFSNALQRIAMIYLDTVQPTLADEYLQKALKYRDRENLWEEASLLKLMAENKANEGQLDEAIALQKKAEQFDSEGFSDSNIKSRVLLRTGRLEEANKLLTEQLSKETKTDRIPRSHRETLLILSFIHNLTGEVDLAKQYAENGIELGKQLASPFIIAVAYMRLGHSLQLSGADWMEQARFAYQEALNIVDELEVVRGRAEPLLGLGLLEGFYGNPHVGLRYSEEGLSIAQHSGDEWLSGMLKISSGINYFFLDKLAEATDLFQYAVNDFRNCKDDFCLFIAKMWLALTYFTAEKTKKYEKELEKIFESSQNANFYFLFTKPTLLGIRDPNLFAPLLIDAGNKFKNDKALRNLLAEKGLTGLHSHPGYTLKIEGFGNLRVCKGKEEITEKDWQRRKSLELFLLLLINRGLYLPKEKIYYYLWPEDDEETAARNFKVTLNALKNALEPNRKPRQESFYIITNRSNYGFNIDSGYEFDIETFEKLIKEANRRDEPKKRAEKFQTAIKLYRGDFAADILYIDWIDFERDRLKGVFLNTVDKLAKHYYLAEDYDEALKMCDLLLEHDLCWEPAYLLKMKIYNRRDRRFVALKVYEQCKQVLDRELNALPMPETQRYYKKLTSSDVTDL